MAKQQTLAAISDETKEMIEDYVKKGKARKFYMICKGVTINTLEVFKKGPFGPKIMKAKGEGFKGEVYYGVVTGSGKELYFQLAGNEAAAAIMKVDGWFDKPPTKRAKLKDFLAENDLAFKPNYYIITDPAFAPDPDSESGSLPAKPPGNFEAMSEDDTPSAKFGAESETDESESSEASTLESPSDTNRFTERLKVLKPEIDKVVAVGGDISLQLKNKVNEAVAFARQKNFEVANASLDDVQMLLKHAAIGDDESEQTGSEDEEDQGSNLSTLFNKRFGTLVGEIKQATGGPHGDQLKTLASEAGALAKQRDFLRAIEVLDKIEGLLKQRTSGGSVLDRWKAARGDVVKTLHSLGSAIVGAKDPEAKEAIILIKAIAANLTETPDTRQKINELERYLVTDDIIDEAEEDNGFGFEVRIREPLLTVLEDLKKEIPA